MGYRRTPIFTAVDPALVSSGLYKDVYSALAPLWASSASIQFVNGKARNLHAGKRLLKPAAGVCRGIGGQQVSNRDKILWVVIGDDLWRWDQFTLVKVTTLVGGGLVAPYVDFTAYGDWMFINQGFGQVKFWNGAAFNVMAEMPTGVAQLRKHLSFLLAIGVGSKETGVAWSDANDISKWNPTSTNSAGSIYFDDFEEGIITAAALGSVVAVYSSNDMGILSFIGSPFYFGQKTMLTGIGAVGSEAVASFGYVNYGLGRQGAWRTDGQQFDYIDSGKMHDYFQENINWSVANLAIVVRNPISRVVEFHLPMLGSSVLNEAWSFDPETGGWSPIPVMSYFNEDTTFGLPLQALADGTIQRVWANRYSKTPLLLKTKPMLLQLQSALGLTDVHFLSRVDEIELMPRTVANVRMRIGSSVDAAVEPSWSPYMAIEPGKTSYLVPAGVPDGVYWTLEFSSVPVSSDVVSATVLVVVGAAQVVASAPADEWEFDLQGFMLFGAIDGTKP